LDPGSNNSKVYTLTVGSTDPETEKSLEQKPSLPGAERIPLGAGALKLIMRFTDPEANLNDAVLVQSEVASMALARDALGPSRALVPRVYSWEAATADGAGWILMEFLPGAPLVGEFEKMDAGAKRAVLKQIALIFKCIQQYEVPDSVQGYGGLGFAENGSIVVGPTPIYGATGACDTYHQLYHQYA
jgi:hypothetical protein